jgi:hypothetical protein
MQGVTIDTLVEGDKTNFPKPGDTVSTLILYTDAAR